MIYIDSIGVKNIYKSFYDQLIYIERGFGGQEKRMLSD